MPRVQDLRVVGVSDALILNSLFGVGAVVVTYCTAYLTYKLWRNH